MSVAKVGDIRSNDGIELCAGFRNDIGVLEEEVDGCGDETGSGAATDWHGYDFVNDLRFGEGDTGLGIFGGHHSGEHILAVCRVGVAVVDEFLSVGAHGFRRRLEFPAVDEGVEEARSGRTHNCLGGGFLHGLEHGMIF